MIWLVVVVSISSLSSSWSLRWLAGLARLVWLGCLGGWLGLALAGLGWFALDVDVVLVLGWVGWLGWLGWMGWASWVGWVCRGLVWVGGVGAERDAAGVKIILVNNASNNTHSRPSSHNPWATLGSTPCPDFLSPCPVLPKHRWVLCVVFRLVFPSVVWKTTDRILNGNCQPQTINEYT